MTKKRMQPLRCLTPFLETGKKLKLRSGETFDSLRQPQPEGASANDPPALKGRKRSPKVSKPQDP